MVITLICTGCLVQCSELIRGPTGDCLDNAKKGRHRKGVIQGMGRLASTIVRVWGLVQTPFPIVCPFTETKKNKILDTAEHWLAGN